MGAARFLIEASCACEEKVEVVKKIPCSNSPWIAPRNLSVSGRPTGPCHAYIGTRHSCLRARLSNCHGRLNRRRRSPFYFDIAESVSGEKFAGELLKLLKAQIMLQPLLYFSLRAEWYLSATTSRFRLRPRGSPKGRLFLAMLASPVARVGAPLVQCLHF